MVPPPDMPGFPRGRLPAREVIATSGAPHTPPPPKPPPPVATGAVDVVAIQGNGWKLSMVALAAILSTLGSIVGPRIAGPQSTPADIQMAQRIEEIDMRVRSIERKVVELGAGYSNQETLTNELRIELAKANRAIQRIKTSEP